MANLDRSYVESYLHDWLKYVRESSKAEQQLIKDGKEFRVPYSGVQENVVKAIFAISSRFEIEPHGKYLAVHLLDRYLGCLFWELVTTALSSYVDSSSPSTSSSTATLVESTTQLPESLLQQVRDNMSSQAKLAFAVCVQIASKVDLYKTGLGISQIQELLQTIDPEHEYSKRAVTAYELRVLRTLDFRLPQWLPLHAVELFLAYVEITEPQVRDTCIQLLDLAYICHDQIFGQLYLMAHGAAYNKAATSSRAFFSLEASAAFIGAVVVTCSAFFHHLKRSVAETLAAKLAKLIGIGPIDIIIMANILFTHAIDEADYELLKRSPKAPTTPQER